jgi:hypothetical protein
MYICRCVYVRMYMYVCMYVYVYMYLETGAEEVCAEKEHVIDGKVVSLCMYICRCVYVCMYVCM